MEPPTGGPPTLRVFLLGRFAVEYRGRPVPRELWRRRRPVELLANLALAPGHALHREEVIDRLWPDKDLESGANNLYRTLHELRRATGPDATAVDRGVVRLAEDAWTDVEAFEEAVAAGDADSLVRAVDLYAGELLPDDPYSDAFAARREGLRQRFIDASLRLARQLGDEDRERTIDILRRLLAVDPVLEEAHRLLMASLARAGRPRDAQRQFAACTRSLREVLDAEPSAETVALHQRIKEGELGAVEGTRAPPSAGGWSHVARRLLGTDRPAPVRGRDEALAEIEAFVARGRGVFLIFGEGGVGKTRLAVEVVRRASAAGAAALVGLGYDFDGTAPYTPFVDAWSDYLRSAGAFASSNPFLSFRPVPGASAQEDRLRLFQSVERSLEELGGDRGVCVLLEDLHQADESSLFLFHHLARAARHVPLMLVGTLREEEVHVGRPLHTLLAGLGRERLAARLHLPRLDRPATAELARDLGFEEMGEDTLDAVYRLAEGNPYYTEEVMRTMRERGLAEPAPSEDLLEGVRQRVARLGPEAERLFAAAAVFGQHFDFAVVERAAHLEPHDALQALERGLHLRIVEEYDERYRFRHALTRQALYGGLTQARRVHLHREVAAALEAQRDAEGTPELLAFHCQAAGEIERSLPHLLTAAERAQSRLGFGEAVQFYEQALEAMDSLGRPPDRERFDALRSMGGMRVALGALDRAVEDLDRAVALRGPGGWRPGRRERAGVLRMGALALIEAGDLEAAEERLDSAWELARGEGGLELSNILYLYSALRWHQSRHREAFELAERCLAEAERQDDRHAIARGYEMLALACHSLGKWRQGNEYEEQRQSLADGTLDVASAFDVHL